MEMGNNIFRSAKSRFLMDELVQRMMLWIVKCSSISFKLKLLMWYSETDIINLLLARYTKIFSIV